MNEFYSNGKLLLTGEYLVLMGAKALAIPTRYGQSMSVEPLNSATHTLQWKAVELNEVWFTCTIDTKRMLVMESSDEKTSAFLVQLLKAAARLSKNNPLKQQAWKVHTKIDFNRNWGLGSSSTLIANVSQWYNINAYDLFRKVSMGSGYDVACAQIDVPIHYQLKQRRFPLIQTLSYKPACSNNMYFVYQGNKKRTDAELELFRHKRSKLKKHIRRISELTDAFTKTNDINELEVIITEHESIMSGILKRETVKNKYFHDFQGVIKSLGAWGGDFMLVVTQNDSSYVHHYFRKEGLEEVFAYKQLALHI